MKKTFMTALLLFLANLIFSQVELTDYENPVLNFQNIASLDSFFSSENQLNGEVYTAINLQKLNFQKRVKDDGNTDFIFDLPFYVNKPIPETGDFGLVMINGSSWSVLDENKEPRVKSYRKIINQGTVIGIEQYNTGLSTPINTPGKYYIRLITSSLYQETYIVYIFVGSIEKRDGFIGDSFNTFQKEETEAETHERLVLNEIEKCRTEISKYAEMTKSDKNKCLSGDCANGFGTFIWQNGEIYSGYWVNNKRNGIGVNKFANGYEYEGEWENDRRQGFGIKRNPNGEIKKGYWEKDNYEGTSYNDFQINHVNVVLNEIAKCRDEINKYSEMVKSGKSQCVSGDCANGFGTYIWSDGEIYSGYWINNKRNGVGINKFSTGTEYEGEWKNDYRQGFGINHKTNGEVEKGNWEQDEYQGK